MRKLWGYWNTRLTEGRLRELYEERGLSIEEIASEVGCCVQTVQRHLAKHGIARRRRGGKPKIRQLTDAELIAAFHEAGDNVSALAATLGVHRTTLSSEFSRRGLKARKLKEGRQ